MFVNLYDNSNIDCNEKVKSKIYDLYQNLLFWRTIIVSNFKVQ